jgi:hypothetical protein
MTGQALPADVAGVLLAELGRARRDGADGFRLGNDDLGT